MMKNLLFILVLILVSCSSSEPEKTIKGKTKKKRNYLYSKFVTIDKKTILPFGKDTLYDLTIFPNDIALGMIVPKDGHHVGDAQFGWRHSSLPSNGNACLGRC